MRGAKIALFAAVLIAASAGQAYADGAAAHALFGGTVTQAPEGNVFGVAVGDPILGEIFFPDYPPAPCFTAT
jgi:hypothetical protein